MEKKISNNNENIIDEKIPLVYIDPNGVFKYVQISCNGKIYVRGIKKYKYHKGIFKSFNAEIEKLNLNKKINTKCIGGGRINHDKENKKILVYGYSNAYGRCEHKLTVEMLKKVYKDYEINWTNEGY